MIIIFLITIVCLFAIIMFLSNTILKQQHIIKHNLTNSNDVIQDLYQLVLILNSELYSYKYCSTESASIECKIPIKHINTLLNFLTEYDMEICLKDLNVILNSEQYKIQLSNRMIKTAKKLLHYVKIKKLIKVSKHFENDKKTININKKLNAIKDKYKL